MCAYACESTPSEYERRIIKSVIKILAAEKKPLTPHELCKKLGVKGDLASLLYRYSANFECFEDGQLFIKLITNVRICETHCSKGKDCPGIIPFCSGLHVCKFYILSGKCKFAGQCTFGHDLSTTHNMQILRDSLLDEVPIEDIKFLLRQTESRSTVTIPRICKFYNVAAGCSKLAGGKPCPNLHICKHYVENSCKFGRNCRRSHDILDKDVKAILEQHGISTRRTPKEILSDLREAVGNGRSESGSIGSADMLEHGVRYGVGRRGDHYESDPSSDENDYHGARGRKGMSGKPPIPMGQPRTPTHAVGPLGMPPVPLGQPRTPTHAVGATGKSPVPLGPQRTPTPVDPFSSPKRRPSSQQRQPRPSSTQRSQRSSSAKGARTDGKLIAREISTDANSRQMICIFNLRGKCAFAESCRNFHGDLPYQWLYKEQSEEEWMILSPMENLDMELTYSDPQNQEYFMLLGQDMKVKVTFKTMTGTDGKGGKFDVHRLSTSSSVEFEHEPLTTVWLWYWKGQTGIWKKYGDDDAGYQSDITSTELEQAYIANPEGQLAFSTLGHEYILDFQKMLQRNLQFRTEREVCRRPVFVSKHEADERRKQLPSGMAKGARKGGGADGVGMVIAPSHWIMKSGEDILDHCQIVEISKKYPSTQKEYKEIEALFCESMPSTVSIKSIERIENGDLWNYYVSKKARMLKKKGGKDVGERRLFHGTPSRYVNAICRQGFDFRLSGQTSGTRFGKGSYFATTSKHSDCYTDPVEKAMFVVKVLVGEYAQGNKDLVRPPSKDKSNPCSDLYDSCVDDTSNPKVFVIFDNSGQVYPEYVIKYEYKYKV